MGQIVNKGDFSHFIDEIWKADSGCRAPILCVTISQWSCEGDSDSMKKEESLLNQNILGVNNMMVYEDSHKEAFMVYPRISEFHPDPGWLTGSSTLFLL